MSKVADIESKVWSRMMRFYRKQSVAIIVLLSGICACALGVRFRLPKMPEEWSNIKQGMNRSKIVSMLSDKVEDLREVKGFDIAIRKYSLLGNRECWWTLCIYYDDTGRMTNANAWFENPSCGLFNSNTIELGFN